MPQRPQNTPIPFPQLSFFRPRMTRFSAIHLGGQNKSENVENFKLKDINSYNATYPNPYYGKKHSQCIQKIPEYRHQSLNEDINQTRICKVTKPKHDTPRGKTKYIRLNSFSDFYYFWK